MMSAYLLVGGSHRDFNFGDYLLGLCPSGHRVLRLKTLLAMVFFGYLFFAVSYLLDKYETASAGLKGKVHGRTL
jgi:hypothetical protein